MNKILTMAALSCIQSFATLGQAGSLMVLLCPIRGKPVY